MLIMKTSLYVTLAASLAVSTNAWAVPSFVKKAASVATASAIIGGSALVSNAVVDLNGSYTDEQHPECTRQVKVNRFTKVAKLTGTDPNPACGFGTGEKAWTLTGKVNGEQILVDETPIGGPNKVPGVWEKGGIRFPDGKKWVSKVVDHF
ncbi:hypothetical protein MPSEU_000031700 [Mayamaea pseudoterrestris]|nr:hypothetical protein MPSEU_000031700 [Mayamaea pseudoterrestris]